MTRFRSVLTCGVAVPLLLGLVLALAPAPASAAQPAQAPTYTRDVQPILQAACVSCHRSGGIAPFSLETIRPPRPKPA